MTLNTNRPMTQQPLDSAQRALRHALNQSSLATHFRFHPVASPLPGCLPFGYFLHMDTPVTEEIVESTKHNIRETLETSSKRGPLKFDFFEKWVRDPRLPDPVQIYGITAGPKTMHCNPRSAVKQIERIIRTLETTKSPVRPNRYSWVDLPPEALEAAMPKLLAEIGLTEREASQIIEGQFITPANLAEVISSFQLPRSDFGEFCMTQIAREVAVVNSSGHHHVKGDPKSVLRRIVRGVSTAAIQASM
jgi:hypothetical protein